MKKQSIIHVLIWVIAILLGIANSSCSSKTKLTEINKEEIKIENTQESENSEKTETNVKVAIVTKVDDKTKTVSTTKTWKPIDPTKPSSKTEPDGKKTEFNNSSYEEKTTTELKDQKTEHSDNSEDFRKKESAAKAKAKEKAAIEILARKDDLDKSGFNFWNWLWLIGIVIISIVLLYLNHRFKLLKRVTAFFKE